MPRSLMRAIPRKTWRDHIDASGPELALAVIALVMMPRYFVLSLPGVAETVQPDWVYFPVLTVASVLAFIGAVSWVVGWTMEYQRGVPPVTRWDQFGAALQMTAWLGGGLLFMATELGSWTGGFQAMMIGIAWLTRFDATGRLVRRAEQVETVMQRADALRTDTGATEVVDRDEEQR